MSFINIEVKARTTRANEIRAYLMACNAAFRGTDRQTDTYFNTATGRLKLREGNIENNLIYYERANQAGPKQSDFSLLEVADPATLQSILTASNGVKVVVKKQRDIFYINNVKFHLDTVEQLGTFVEIEAGNRDGAVNTDELQEQCSFYVKAFGIEDKDLITVSYSDMLLSTAEHQAW